MEGQLHSPRMANLCMCNHRLDMTPLVCSRCATVNLLLLNASALSPSAAVECFVCIRLLSEATESNTASNQLLHQAQKQKQSRGVRYSSHACMYIYIQNRIVSVQYTMVCLSTNIDLFWEHLRNIPRINPCSMDFTCNFVGKVLQISVFAARFCSACRDSCRGANCTCFVLQPVRELAPELECSRD